MLIVDCVLQNFGWSPIHHMMGLATRHLEGKLIEARSGPLSRWEKLHSILPGRRRGGEACLLICAGPGDLWRVMSLTNWRRRFDWLGAWIIDSFWWDHIPAFVRFTRPFDHLFVTCSEDVEQWKKRTRVPTTWLPWGTDALALGSGNALREWDLTRVGRQPPPWDDDASNAAAAARSGLNYRGRVPGHTLTALQNQQMMMREVYPVTKYLLAFSNAANPERYTHPTRQYLTGRWVDALAAGAVVAGVCPRSEDAEQLLWRGATLELGGIERAHGLQVLAEARAQWSAQNAAHNHLMALARLDWRWRFKALADVLGVQPPTLLAELALLKAHIEEHQSAPSSVP